MMLKNFHDVIIKKNSIKHFTKKESYLSDTDNFKRRNLKREQTITAYKINNDDNSQEILYNLDDKKNLNFTGSLKSYNKNKAHGIRNSSFNSRFLKNQTIIKSNKINFDLNSKNNNIKEEEDDKDSNGPKEIMNKIFISKSSINNIDYDNPNTVKRLKHISSLIDFTKSLIFKKEKTNYHYIHLFRMHLLSEEHLLKSHITLVLIEKKYNINSDESTNFFECYDKL